MSQATSFWLPAATLWQRELVRFFRQRSRVAGALASPLVFWVVIGSGFGRSFRPPAAAEGVGYLEYFFPGTVVLVLLFAAIFSTISIIEDRSQGFLQSVLAAPITRASLVLGKVLGGATVAFVQGLLLLLLAPLLSIHLSVPSVAGLTLILFTLAFALTSLGFLIAWHMESTQGFHAIMNLFLIPMWLLSGALFPASGAAGWIRAAMAINPLSYGLAAVRQLIDPAAGNGGPSFAVAVSISLGFAVVLYAAAALSARRTRAGGGP
ncbi:MAG: ABC transporter permease [Planctomycetota bacterium]